ncbi:conserved hypothetical protein [Vibrio chagasii]|nr:conserved hypothetical protein [Vibrio chagasii]
MKHDKEMLKQAKRAYAQVQPVSTFGWDTAYVASYDVVNHAIDAQKKFPQSMDYLDQESSLTLAGSWENWQLSTGGAGQNVQMSCSFDKGNVTMGTSKYDISGTKLIIQVNLEKVASKDPLGDPEAKPGTGETKNVVVKQTPTGEDPAVSVITCTTTAELPGLIKEVLPQVFANYFNDNVNLFGSVFGVMNINSAADKDGFQWIKPSAFDYAVASTEDGSSSNSAFGLIAMVDGASISGKMQQAVDARALQGLSEGANSAFVISTERMVQNMLLPGAVATLQGTTADDFNISKDGLSVTNNKDVSWGNFKLQDGSTISPTIPKGNFILKVENSYIEFSVTGAHWEPQSGVTAYMNSTQKFTYKTVQRDDGKYVFIPDISGLGSPQVSSSINVSEWKEIESILKAVTFVAAGMCCGAIAGELIEGVAEAADVAEDEASLTADCTWDGEALQNLFEENPDDVNAMLEQGADDADAGALDPEDADQIQEGGMWSSSTFRTFRIMCNAMAGFEALEPYICKALYKSELSKIPAFDTFASNCLGATAWPETKDYVLKSAELRSSLVLNMALDPASN